MSDDTSYRHYEGDVVSCDNDHYLEALLDFLPDSIYFKDTAGHFLLINRALANRLGIDSPQDAIGKTDFDFFSQEHAQQAFDDEQSIIRTGNPIIAKTEKETWHDRGPLWVATTKMPLYDRDGRIVGTFGISRDVTAQIIANEDLKASREELRKHRDHLEDLVNERTNELQVINNRLVREIEERRQAEEALRTSEERYRALLDTTPTYVYTVYMRNGHAVATEHSEGCINVTGYSPGDYRENPNLWLHMVHPEDREMVRSFVDRDLAHYDGTPIEHRIIHKDGTLRWVRNTVVHHYNDRNELERYDGLVEDITERKLAEQAQRESEQFKAIGSLAGGVAESLGNVITIVRGCAQSIVESMIPGTSCHSDGRQILDTMRYTDQLANRLLNMARFCETGGNAMLDTVWIDDVLQQAAGLVQHVLAENNIDVDFPDNSTCPAIMAHGEQLLDILVGLLGNAVEIMPGGGVVRINCSTRRINTPGHRWNSKAESGRFAVLRVIYDDDSADLSRIDLNIKVQPDSRIDQHSRMGWGMSMACSLIENWGGWMQQRSKNSGRTVVRMFLPQVDAARPAAVSETVRPLTGSTVLVIDDNSAILENIRQILITEGCRVLATSDAQTGLDLFTAHSSEVDLVVLDVLLPGFCFDGMLERIMKQRSDARVMVISGFCRDYIRHCLGSGSWFYLQKPFDAAQLTGMLRKMLAT